MARQAARKELQRRQDARTSLLGFTTYTKPDYRVGPHHPLICQKLEAVTRGEISRLIISAPPRHGKSELTSIRLPAWYLGRNPTKQVITASHGADLAEKFGRDVRNLFSESSFRALFPEIGIAADSSARGLWHTTKGGVYAAVGVGGSATGKGADLALIDDPFKGRAEADSEVIRESVWDWYRSVLRTRLMPGGSIILINTRWHPSDLSGRLIEEMEAGTGERWEVLNLPAIALDNDPLGRLPGEPLWPSAYDLEALAATELSLGDREWSALYQGAPTSGQGGVFKVAQLQALDAAPAGGTVVRAWDLAATAQVGTRDPDWTVGFKLARYPDGRFGILDVVRLRGGPDEVEAAIVNTASQDGRGIRISLPQDPGQAGKTQVLYLTRKLAGYAVESSPETGDKATRAAPLASQVNAGNVFMVKAPWNRALLDEMAGFPAAAHDDCVDAGSRAFSVLVAPPQPARVIQSPISLGR